MSDIAKWAILIAGVIALIALIVTMPFAQYLNTDDLTYCIDVILEYCSGAFGNARELINCFLFPFARNILSGLMVYLLISWVFKLSVKIGAWIFHFIFK